MLARFAMLVSYPPLATVNGGLGATAALACGPLCAAGRTRSVAIALR